MIQRVHIAADACAAKARKDKRRRLLALAVLRARAADHAA